MKKLSSIFISILTCLVLVFAISITANAAQIDSDEITEDGTRVVYISPNGDEDDTKVIRKIFVDTQTEPLVVNFAAGEYTLSNSLPMFDNTTINATGAVFNQITDGKGILINGYFHSETTQSSYGKGKGGYNSLNNLSVNGGTYVGTAKPNTTKTLKDNGFYVGYSTFLFMHAQNITIKNCTFKNNYNGHFIEFAGVNNATVTNCNLGVSDSKYVGEKSNEAIQIDNTYQSSNSPSGAPWDDTASKNITISNCKINFPRGIGTNRVGKSFYSNIKIDKCNITSSNEALNMYDVLGLKITNCTVNTTGKYKDYRSVALYVGLDSKPNKSQYKSAKTYISNNKITGYTAAVKVWNINKSAKFKLVQINNNKLNSRKSKDSALQVTKSVEKLTNKKNTIKKVK